MKDNQILVGAVDVQTVFGESWQDQTKGEEQGKGFALALGYDSTGQTSLLVRLEHYSPPDGELIEIGLHRLNLDDNGYADINGYYAMAEAIVDCRAAKLFERSMRLSKITASRKQEYLHE